MLLNKRQNASNNLNILFLARTERSKGIFEAIEAYKIFKKRNSNINVSLTIAGDGFEFENVKEYLISEKIIDVILLGHIDGPQKAEAYCESDVYLFPSYSEGMPNSVLEAMAFGLPVLSSAVGALPYIIKDDINGYTTESIDPEILASYLQKLINPEVRYKIGLNNTLEARSKYISTKVVERLQEVYNNVNNY